MKLILNSIAMIAIISSFALGQTASQSTSCEQTAKDLETKISKITQDLDKKAFEDFVSDDVIIINSDGETLSKKKQLASFFTPPPNLVLTFTSEDTKIRACGDSSIITTGKDVLKATNTKSKKSADQNWWFTRIYEKRQGRWQLIYNQLTNADE